MPWPARQRQVGFSLTELIVALVVAMILMAVALPMAVRAYHSYQLTNAAQQLADMLLFTRYEAIRLNKTLSCTISSSATPPGMSTLPAGTTGVWTASRSTVVLLGSSGNVIDGGTVPNITGLISQAVGTAATTAPSSTGSMIWFDARGAVSPPTNVNVFYLQSAQAPEAGYRAVLLMPAGSLQIWSTDSSGNWQRQR